MKLDAQGIVGTTAMDDDTERCPTDDERSHLRNVYGVNLKYTGTF